MLGAEAFRLDMLLAALYRAPPPSTVRDAHPGATPRRLIAALNGAALAAAVGDAEAFAHRVLVAALEAASFPVAVLQAQACLLAVRQFPAALVVADPATTVKYTEALGHSVPDTALEQALLSSPVHTAPPCAAIGLSCVVATFLDACLRRRRGSRGWRRGHRDLRHLGRGR